MSAVARFQETGLERADRLSKDIAFFKDEYQLEPSIQEDGPGRAYSRSDPLTLEQSKSTQKMVSCKPTSQRQEVNSYP